MLMLMKVKRRPVWTLLLIATMVTGCSIKKYAINKIGDTLASGGSVYESDEDIVLVGEALPFGLKLIETLIAESPKHRGLLLAATRGFVLYSYAYVHYQADVATVDDIDRGNALRTRARKLYQRALDYGLRGLERSHPQLRETLITDPQMSVASMKEKNLPLLYWTAAALGLAISVSRSDPEMLARLPEVEAMLQHAIELNPTWEGGALQEFQLVFEGAKPGASDMEAMKVYYQKALRLSEGKRAGVYVAYAEAVAIPTQNRAQFRSLLDKALAIDPDEHKEIRLANLIAQRRARWLLGRVDELFFEEEAADLAEEK